MVVTSAISKTLKGNRVLDNVSLDIAPGTAVGLIGPSGAGKSTLLRVLAAIESADEGCLTLFGSTLEFPIKKRSRLRGPWPDVTLVFQNLYLWPHLTLQSNVMLPICRRAEGSLERSGQLMERFGIEHLQFRYPNEVSGGQRQLFALVRAIALRPKLLLLDEVTSALDPEKTRVVRETIREEVGSGVAVALVSHSLEFLKKSVDRVIFLDHGSVIEEGGTRILEDPQTDRLKAFLDDADNLTIQKT